MESVKSQTIKENLSDDSRIGDLKPTANVERLKEVEEIIKSNCPLTASFDVAPLQQPYFTEFTYTNFNNWFYVTTMSPEFNARYTMSMSKLVKTKSSIFTLADKYETNSFDGDLQKSGIDGVVFLPGSNLEKLIDYALLDKVMMDPKNIIKVHPLTNDEMLRRIGMRYGYYRIIGPEFSGVDILKQASKVFYTENSEMGLYANDMGKPAESISRLAINQAGTYFTIYDYINKFSDLTTIKKQQTLWKFFDNYTGILNINDSDEVIEAEIKSYYNTATELRGKYAPVLPKFDYGLWANLSSEK